MSDLNEPILEDDYPVYGDYLYVVDGRVVRSDVFGTVRDLKRSTGGATVRRCDISGRIREEEEAEERAANGQLGVGA